MLVLIIPTWQNLGDLRIVFFFFWEDNKIEQTHAGTQGKKKV